MVKFPVEFWWKMLLTIFPAKEARKSPAKLRRKFATNFAENFADFTLEIAGAYNLHRKTGEKYNKKTAGENQKI